MTHRLESHQVWEPGKSQLNTYEANPYFRSLKPFVTQFDGGNTAMMMGVILVADQLILRAMNQRGMQ